MSGDADHERGYPAADHGWPEHDGAVRGSRVAAGQQDQDHRQGDGQEERADLHQGPVHQVRGHNPAHHLVWFHYFIVSAVGGTWG